MARLIDRLTQRFVDSVEVDKDRLFADGQNLYLRVYPDGRRQWEFLCRLHGRDEDLGLGSARDVTLKEARAAAHGLRQLLRQGISPLTEKKKLLAQRRAETEVKHVTFMQATEGFLKVHSRGWSEGHRRTFSRGLQLHADPVIGKLDVAAVKQEHLLQILTPIWTDSYPTASRVRADVERVLTWAQANGYRHEGTNPASLALLHHKLGDAGHRTESRAMMPYAQVPAFCAKLRQRDDIPARLLEFTILCGSREAEATFITWEEVDLSTATWTISTERFKSRRPHKVMLSPRATEILKSMPKTSLYCFPSPTHPKRPLSYDSNLRLLRSMGETTVTGHGFRSSLRTWISECTNVPSQIAELTLGHQLSNELEKIYDRSEHIAARRRLMSAWADFLAGKTDAAKVVPIRA